MKKPKVRKVEDRGREMFVVQHKWFKGPEIRLSFKLEANARRYTEAYAAGDTHAMLKLAWSRLERKEVEVRIQEGRGRKSEGESDGKAEEKE